MLHKKLTSSSPETPTALQQTLDGGGGDGDGFLKAFKSDYERTFAKRIMC